MGALLARLNDDERRALTAASIFQGALDRAMLAHCGADETMAARWHNLSLVQHEADARHGTARYSLHPVVREFLLGRLGDDERRRLHLRAASFYQERIVAPFRDRLLPEAKGHEREAVMQLLEMLVRQTQNMDLARGAMELGIAWRAHLYAAGQDEQAGSIVTAIQDILARWGQRDLAKGLLRESIATLDGFTQAVARGDLASLLKDEGRLDEALAIYEEVYSTFRTLGAKKQMAAMLSLICIVYGMKGYYSQAFMRQEEGLAIEREIGNKEGQAIGVNQLSILYALNGDFTTALSLSQEAEVLSREVGNEALNATTLHQQGIIHSKMKHPHEAVTRFQKSLEISRRIGDKAKIAESLGEVGKLLMDVGQVSGAIGAFSEALEIDRQLGRPDAVGADLEFLGNVHERQGQYTAALEKYEEALRLAQQYNPPSVPIEEQHVARVKGKNGGVSADRKRISGWRGAHPRIR